jgi:hypothetical protein
MQAPMPPTMEPHVCPVGHPLRGDEPHPGVQKPCGPLQTRPEVASPQAPSPSAPVQPQLPVSERQTGLAPPHSVALPAEHSVQAPASGPDR